MAEDHATMASTKALHLGHRDVLAAFFRDHPFQVVTWELLEQMVGRNYQQRISEARRQLDMNIENVPRRSPEGKRLTGDYRFRPEAHKPKGEQCLGGCVVDVTEDDAADASQLLMLRFPHAQAGAEWIAAASRRAHTLGCNPGGEMASVEVPSDHPMLAHYPHGVLMDRSTIERIDAEIEAANASR